MTEELKEQIHERIYNLKVPTLGFSRQDLFDIAMEYAEPREKRIEELIALINAERERQEKCDDVHLRTIADLEKENAELKEKLTAIRNAKDKYDMSKDKSIIKAFGAEYTLFCDLELILEDWQEDDKLTNAKEIIREFVEWATWQGNSKCPSFKSIQDKAEQFLKDCEVE